MQVLRHFKCTALCRIKSSCWFTKLIEFVSAPDIPGKLKNDQFEGFNKILNFLVWF